MNEINWHNRARKQIKQIPANYREAIHERVDLLAEYPNCPGLDVKELRWHEYGFRLRVSGVTGCCLITTTESGLFPYRR